MKTIILVDRVRCKNCGRTGYTAQGVHMFKSCGRKARYENIQVEEVYAGELYHGKLSNYKIVRVEREAGDE